MTKTALITGITGQDGSYLAELLLWHGYEVHGIIRRSSTINTRRIDHIYEESHSANARLFLHYGDLTSSMELASLVREIKPTEIYHLGAQSHVQTSFQLPEYTAEATGVATLRILEAVKQFDIEAKVYIAGSSEMFGNAPAPQSEATILEPRSPYAAAKVYSVQMARIYRDGHGMRTGIGVLFNHESPRRGETFVTRKITRAIARILAGTQERLYLGNLDSRRDWGYAPEYVEAMWQIIQQDQPDDFVIGTGESHTIREFLEEAFSYVSLDYLKYVEIDERYFRPLEVNELQADATKAHELLNWRPTTSFSDLVKIMVDADLQSLGLDNPGEGQSFVEQKCSEWHKWMPALP